MTVRLNPFTILFFALGLTLLFQGLDAWRRSAHLSNPRAMLLAATARDPDLAVALASADQGRILPLSSWLNRVDALRRQDLGVAVLATVRRDPGLAESQVHRLRALVGVPSGLAALDDALANLLAYTLVEDGRARPPELVALTGQLADRLEQTQGDAGEHAYWDTIACVRFRQGNHAAAVRAWERALAGVPADQLSSRDLYARRLAAAQANVAGTQPALSLPRESVASTASQVAP